MDNPKNTYDMPKQKTILERKLKCRIKITNNQWMHRF